MDIQTSLIYVGIVGACAAVLFAVSMFGIKEKTYDEAIAEQRQLPNEHLLLARSKEKNKDKKQKKAAGKKVKEKPAEQERVREVNESVPESGAQHHEKHHVEFEPEEEILTQPPPQDEKKIKKKKMKPILVNKSEHSATIATQAAALPNHFEQSLPKDDLLLKRQLSKEEMNVPKQSVHVKLAPKPGKVSSVSKTEKVAVIEKLVEPSVVELDEALPVVPVVTKEQRTRKKRSELATLQQMTGDREGINVSVIVPLVQKAELSRSEIQILIDLLLNKQQGSAVTNSEWSEGRQDPMVKLKKQLAEKEKALSDEQEAAQAFQNKMKELRTELNTERSRWRQVEEAVGSKQLELQHAATRLQHAQEAHKNDKANMSQQLQHLQAQLQEERGQSQGALNVQRQQLDLHIAHLADQHKDAETVLKSQLNQLHGQLQEMEKVNAALRGEVQNVRDNVGAARDAEVNMYRDQVGHLGNQVQQHENLAREQLEEMAHLKAQLEHHKTSTAGIESQLKYTNDKLRKELESVNYALSKSSETHKSDAARLQAEKESLLATIKDLQASNQQAKQELSDVKRDCQQLREDNESLAAQVTAVTERPAAEGRENGDTSYPEEKPTKKEDSAQLDNMLKQHQVQELTLQINTYKTEISQLNADLETQRTKNNELRTRNWKAMEAVAATEKSLENQLKDSKKLVDNSCTATRLEEQAATKQLLARLFPDVQVAACEPHATWVQRFVAAAQSELKKGQTEPQTELEKQVAQLQAAVAHYKTIIQDTEVLLTKLQNSAEEEEVKWREKLLQQEAELEAVREERDRLADSTEEDQERLRNELEAAQEKSREMNREMVKLRSQLQIGQASLSQEQQLAQQLQQQVDKLNGLNEKHNAVATNGASTETSITEGGSGKK